MRLRTSRPGLAAAVLHTCWFATFPCAPGSHRGVWPDDGLTELEDLDPNNNHVAGRLRVLSVDDEGCVGGVGACVELVRG